MDLPKAFNCISPELRVAKPYAHGLRIDEITNS